MTNEATLKIETHKPISFQCADGTGIEKGAILKMTDNMTASLSDGDTDIVAGIAQSEKIANTGGSSVSVYRGGIFRGVAGTAGVTVGHAIITDSSTSGENQLVDADVNSENIVGTALETAASGNTFLFELNPIVVNLA